MLIHSYERYLELGGSLERTRFDRLLQRARIDIRESKTCIAQVTAIALASAIEVDCTGDLNDERVAVYKLLRTNAVADVHTANRHISMCDIQIFAETLRVVADVESLKKLAQAYPQISFNPDQ